MDESKKKAIGLAMKLKALADRGVGGEKINAASLYKRHLEKHGLTDEDVIGSVKELFYFKYKPAEDELLSMIICHVVPNALIFKDEKKHKNKLIVECKKAEAERIDKLFGFYLACYQNEQKYLLQAFLHKNNLEPNIKIEEDVYGYDGTGNAHDGIVKEHERDHKKEKEAREGGQQKISASKPAEPVQSVTYSPYEARKIAGLMSWMQVYEMTEKYLSASKKEK